jgi:hypothetical protein
LPAGLDIVPLACSVVSIFVWLSSSPSLGVDIAAGVPFGVFGVAGLRNTTISVPTKVTVASKTFDEKCLN